MLQMAMLTSVMAVVLGFTTDVHAACSGVFCVGRVDRLFPHATQNQVFVATDGIETDLSCDPITDIYLRLSPSQPLFTQIYNTLLEAVSRSLSVRIRLPESGVCQIQYVVLIRPGVTPLANERDAGED
jgi:hypothetical protein